MTIEAGQAYAAPHAPQIVVASVTGDVVKFHSQTNPGRIESAPLDAFEKWVIRVSARIVASA